MRVLLISDDTDLIVALQILLREEPCCDVIATASHSNAALSLLAADTIDLIMLDWDLHNGSSRRILASVQNLTDPPRVIAIGKDEGDESAAVAAGANNFAHKGASPMGLINALHTLERATKDQGFPAKRE